MTQNKTPQNPVQTPRKRYEICSICNESFSYPEMPYRVYSVEQTEHGLAADGIAIYASASLREAERWANENCRHIVTCI